MTKTYGNYSDFITFTRASSATYMDSDGLIKTAATNAPRIEYDSNGIRKGLLIEEARTNILIRSEEFDNAQWTKNNFGTVGLPPVVTANQAIAPDGTLTADRIVFDAVDSTGQSDVSNSSATSLTGVCTASVWLKAESGTPTVQLRIDFSGGSHAENFVLTNEWQRYVVTMPSGLSGAVNVNRFSIRLRPSTGTSISATVLAWGAQLEAGSFPTSYIPTAGAAAIRAADVASIPTNAFGYNHKAGTVVVDFDSQFGTTGFPRVWEIGGTSTGINRANVYIGAGGSNIRVYAAANNVTAIEATVRNGPSPASGKLAFAFSDNDFAGVIDGESPVTDTSGSFTTPSVPRDTLKIGGSATSANDNMSGHIKSIQYYPRRLTNAQLQALTA